MMISQTDTQFITYLQKNCRYIDFFQIVRFLYHFVQKTGGKPLSAISITPSLYTERLPQNQVIALHSVGGKQFEIEYNEYAIYGTYGCLPEGFTQRISKYESDGRTEPKSFLDIFHSYLNHLAFRNQLSNKTLVKLVEFDKLDDYKGLLYGLAGIPAQFFDFDADITVWLKYRRLLTGKNKNSLGLQYLLEQFFLHRKKVLHFTVEEAYLTRENAKDHKLNPIGDAHNKLGKESYIGSVFQNTQMCLCFHFTLETLEQYYELVYSELIHEFTNLALAYCGVHYAFLLSFDDIYQQGSLEDNQHIEPQLGVNALIHSVENTAEKSDTNTVLLKAHEFIYAKMLRKDPQDAQEEIQEQGA